MAPVLQVVAYLYPLETLTGLTTLVRTHLYLDLDGTLTRLARPVWPVEDFVWPIGILVWSGDGLFWIRWYPIIAELSNGPARHKPTTTNPKDVPVYGTLSVYIRLRFHIRYELQSLV